MAEEEEENIFSFRDKTPAPDPTHEYSDTVRDAHTPIIIDNGNKFVRLKDLFREYSQASQLLYMLLHISCDRI